MHSEITREQSSSIIEIREPRGTFFLKEGDVWVGIDNQTGDAFVEEFETKELCFAWLNGDFEINDLLDDAVIKDEEDAADEEKSLEPLLKIEVAPYEEYFKQKIIDYLDKRGLYLSEADVKELIDIVSFDDILDNHVDVAIKHAIEDYNKEK